MVSISKAGDERAKALAYLQVSSFPVVCVPRSQFVNAVRRFRSVP